MCVKSGTDRWLRSMAFFKRTRSAFSTETQQKPSGCLLEASAWGTGSSLRSLLLEI